GYNVADLLFDLINLKFPDPSDIAREWTVRQIRWSLSSVIVAFPVFLSAAWLIARTIGRDPTKRASKIRSRLTYGTLFIASSVLIGDFTYVIYSFLGGELTVRFVLKALVVAVIAGTAFGYYLWDLRANEKEPET